MSRKSLSSGLVLLAIFSVITGVIAFHRPNTKAVVVEGCDLLAYWRFNNSGADDSGNGHDLSITVSGVAYADDASGNSESAAYFDTGRMETSTPIEIGAFDPYMLAFQWKADGNYNPTWRDIIAGSQYSLDSGLHVYQGKVVYYPPATTTPPALTNDTWYDVVFIFDGDGTAQILTRPAGVGSYTTSDINIWSWNGSSGWYFDRIGASGDGWNEYTRGTIDNMRFIDGNDLNCLDVEPPESGASSSASSAASSSSEGLPMCEESSPVEHELASMPNTANCGLGLCSPANTLWEATFGDLEDPDLTPNDPACNTYSNTSVLIGGIEGENFNLYCRMDSSDVYSNPGENISGFYLEKMSGEWGFNTPFGTFTLPEDVEDFACMAENEFEQFYYYLDGSGSTVLINESNPRSDPSLSGKCVGTVTLTPVTRCEPTVSSGSVVSSSSSSSLAPWEEDPDCWELQGTEDSMSYVYICGSSSSSSSSSPPEPVTRQCPRCDEGKCSYYETTDTECPNKIPEGLTCAQYCATPHSSSSRSSSSRSSSSSSSSHTSASSTSDSSRSSRSLLVIIGTAERCGDGTLQAKGGEQCDDGGQNVASPDDETTLWCSMWCTRPVCGDSIDNDGDGKKDRDDPGCYDASLEPEPETGLWPFIVRLFSNRPEGRYMPGRSDERCTGGYIEHDNACVSPSSILCPTPEGEWKPCTAGSRS